MSSFRHFVPLIYQKLLNSLKQICNTDHCLVVWAQLVLLSPASVYKDHPSLATWLRVRPTCVFMWQKLEQGADSVELHKDVVLIRHRGDDVHLLKDVIQLQLGLHESDKKKKNPLCQWHAAVKDFLSCFPAAPSCVDFNSDCRKPLLRWLRVRLLETSICRGGLQLTATLPAYMTSRLGKPSRRTG